MGPRRIGVISDTHGLLRPEALTALRGVDLIIHAGDAGAPEVLDGLRALAPVRAVRGNVDREPWARNLPTTDAFEIGEVGVCVLHDLGAFDLAPDAARRSTRELRTMSKGGLARNSRGKRRRVTTNDESARHISRASCHCYARRVPSE